MVYCDNQSAQQIANYEGKQSRTKHMDYKNNFIREAIDKGAVKISYLQTELMAADGLTKAVTRDKQFLCFQSLVMKFEHMSKC